MSYTEIARWAVGENSLPAAPDKSTIGKLLKSSESMLRQASERAMQRKRLSPLHLLIDQNVVDFVMLAEADGISLSGAMIIQHGVHVATKLRIPRERWPRFGPSWLRCLQARYGFKWRRAFGESGSVKLDVVQYEIVRLRRLVKSYLPKNVYNMDESAFFYNAVPRGSICKGEAPALKQNKARLTMAVCSNADGSDKMPILYLGTAAKPRWYTKKPSTLHYFNTDKGWITGWMYQQWLVAFDERMRAEKRSVLLLVDNASSHFETGLSLSNVHVEKLPPNTTAKIQPMDQGIIHCIKRYVLTEKMLYALDQIGDDVDNPYSVDMLTALLWCEKAWSKVSPSTIQHCWHHSSLLNKASVTYLLN